MSNRHVKEFGEEALDAEQIAEGVNVSSGDNLQLYWPQEIRMSSSADRPIKPVSGEMEVLLEIPGPVTIVLAHSSEHVVQTTASLVDTLKQHLVMVTAETPEKLEDRKYYFQAFHLLWLGAAEHGSIDFIVNLSDLTLELVAELRDLDKQTRQFVLKQAVGRIFEDVNFELYHNSISRNLKVRLEK